MKNFIQNALGAKKLSLFVLVMLMSIAGIQRANAANEIYATLSGSTMTLYYDDQKASHSDLLDKWTPEKGAYKVPDATRETITKAVIDASMEDARPTSTRSWFWCLANLTTIEGLANFNTSEVTTMYDMFIGCSSLTSLDLTGFNTAKVENMSYMFSHCYALTSLDVSKFNTANVSTMEGMFYGCTSLTSLDVSKFNTANVKRMYNMFYGCTSLTSLDVSNFNTESVTVMDYMFYYCSSLTTIYCDEDWSTGSATSDNMFYGCTSLEGGKGTAYNSDKNDKTYARPDGMGGKPGYFTAKGVVKTTIYATLSEFTMTLYYDDQKDSRSDVLDKWSAADGTYYLPEETRNSITKVVINPSMEDARPASTRSWFWNLANLTTIDGLANLNTSEVTDMYSMFSGCTSLTSLDVSNFNTDNVQNMNYVFAHCSSLTSLDVSNFNTDNVSGMEGMFYACKLLTSLDVSNFNTANVTTMYGMFNGCSSLTTINCEDDWSTSSATSDGMFYGCTSLEGGNGTAYNSGKTDATYARLDGLDGKPGYFSAKGVVRKTIYATLSGSTMTLYYDDQKASRSDVLNKWNPANGTYYLPEETRNSITKVVINPSMEDARPTSTHSWFWGLANLTTIEGLANFNTSEVTDMYSMFSGCTSLTSLDLTGFNTAKVQNMNYVFAHCYALTSLDVSKFNTDNVSGMEGMFYACKSLTSLDVSNFNTANVTTMYGMFNGCSSLTTINCEDDWSTSSATSDGMFYGCTSLEGGNGTAYNSGKTDATYARLDGLDGKPGYFSAKGVVRKTIYATLSGSSMTLYYDDQKASRSDVLDKWSPGQGTSYVPEETRNSITKAVIDPSMVDARPVATKMWFGKLKNLTTIDGLTNLNTSEVTDMSYMFYDCESLTSLDLTGFNTAKVENIRYIFYSCLSLTELDVSNFNTAKMSDMRGMFQICDALTTIYCEDDWSTSSATSDGMFYGCTALEGGNGTAYNSDKIDATYARPDGLDGKPGYFTAKGTVKKTIYATLSGSTMTLYYDDQKASRSGVLDKWSAAEGTSNVPEETCNSITKAVIDPSMVDARPVATKMWFGKLKNLTTIDGLTNLNTSEVTDMSYMFYDCKSLTLLDLTGFNTANVTNMKYMFYGCSSLTTIYCDEDWSTGSATSDNMFDGCIFLEGGKGTKYDADKIDATYARPDGMGDKPGYFTANGTGPKEIYAALNGSTMTIYFDNKKASRPGVLDKWTPGMGVDMDDATCYSITKAVIAPSIAAALPTKTNFWFWNLANLTAIYGLANLNTSEVTNMSGMFMYCALLTEVDVSTFNTGKVTNMRSMFSSCPSLTELDLTGFNTGKVSDMETMFYGCSSLKAIYCNETWTPSSSDNMFYGCTSLEGGKGTKYDADKADKTYARPDGLGGQLGYFTVSAAPLTPEELKEIDAVIDLINAIGTVTYTPESKALIDAARAAYDALTDLQKEFVTNYSVLTDAEQAYAELKQKAEADLAVAGIVMAKIDAIGTVAYTEASKALIDAARTAYDALTAAQKVLVTNYGVLTAAEKAYADLKAKAEADQAAANAVIVKIDAIGTVTLSSEAAILDARSAYNALTADQKALVTNLPTLVAAEAALDQLKKQAAADQAAANIVISKISAIGTVEYTTESKERIDAAREAYDGLTAAQQVLVTNYGVLTAAEKAYADLKAKAEADQAAANAVIVKIDAIGDVTLASEPAIVAARSAYDALTAAQKLLVTNLSTLTAAEAKLEILKKQAESDEAAAKAVTDLINAIGTVTYTSESKARIDAAREAYDALTATQKALVTNLSTLTAAEQAYADLKKKADADQAAANVVIAKIDAIGTVTLESEAAILNARSAYDALTPAQQALVTNFGTLLSAEATLELLKHQAETDKAAADAVIAKINAIGTVTLESEAAILDARSAYDALTAAQKALVTNLSTLTAAEKKLAELKANAEAVENAKLQLKNIVSQANELKAVALIYAPSAVSDLESLIADAQSMIDDPNATVDQINAKTATLTDNLNTLAVNLLDQAKEQLKQSIIALFLPGDYPSWYASVITPALNQVDGMAWDFNKTVNENIVFFQTTGQNLYNATKAALEALRASDKRLIISSCAFTGFENAVRTDMTWDISALNDLINTLNTSVASEPYRLDAEMSSLGKWDPVNEELIILDPTEAQTLTAGDYRFISAVRIDGEEANLYRLPKATEEVLSVTVDGAVWTIDLSGIVIDVAYCYTVVKSPMFTVSKGEDVELVNEDRIKTQKIFRDGHIYILRGDHIFDIRGTMVR